MYVKSFDQYDDYIIESIKLTIINESVNLNIEKFVLNVLRKIKTLSFERQKKIFSYLVVSLLFVAPIGLLNVLEDADVKKELSSSQLEDFTNDVIAKQHLLKNPLEMKLSDKGIKHIKNEEGDPRRKGEPILKSYELGDDMITIGWGHALPIEKNKNYTISRQEAERLLKKDIEVTTQGIHRIFKKWSDTGLNIKITQDMFDALISISFNTGVGAVRKSDIVKELKRGNMLGAGYKIKDFKIPSKFSKSLTERRKREADLFLSFFNN